MISNSPNSLDAKNSYTGSSKPGPLKPVEPEAGATATNQTAAVVPKEPDKRVAEEPAVKPEKVAESQEELARRVADAIPRVRELMQKNQRSLDFEVAEQENRIIITVIDKETDKVIRQIPPEDVLQIAEAIEQGLEQNLGGILLNSKV